MHSFLYYAAVTSYNSCIATLKFSNSFLLTYIFDIMHFLVCISDTIMHSSLTYKGSVMLSFLMHPVLPCMHSFAMYLALHALLSYVFGAVMHSFSRQCHAVLSYNPVHLPCISFWNIRQWHAFPGVVGAVHCFSYIGCRHVGYSIPCPRHWHCHAFLPEVGIIVMNLFYTGAVMHSFPRIWHRHAFLS